MFVGVCVSYSTPTLVCVLVGIRVNGCARARVIGVCVSWYTHQYVCACVLVGVCVSGWVCSSVCVFVCESGGRCVCSSVVCVGPYV